MASLRKPRTRRALKEPTGPWFVNVTHALVHGRPECCSPVDYARVDMSEDWSEVDCAACHRERRP